MGLSKDLDSKVSTTNRQFKFMKLCRNQVEIAFRYNFQLLKFAVELVADEWKLKV